MPLLLSQVTKQMWDGGNFWSHSTDPPLQSLQYFHVKNTLLVKENNQHSFESGLWHAILFLTQRSCSVLFAALLFCFRFILENPSFISVKDSMHRKRSLETASRGCFRSSVNTFGKSKSFSSMILCTSILSIPGVTPIIQTLKRQFMFNRFRKRSSLSSVLEADEWSAGIRPQRSLDFLLT